MSDSNIVVLPIDFSEFSRAAVPWARRLAAMTNGKVHCIYAVEPPQIYSALDIAPAVALPTTEELAENAKQHIAAFTEEHLAGVDTETHILTGRPAEQIVAYAKEVDAALIVMTTHGYSGLEHVLLGSTTETVLRKADCPVLSVRNG
jgi:nucleotide-binding universal stress UspA family protein